MSDQSADDYASHPPKTPLQTQPATSIGVVSSFPTPNTEIKDRFKETLKQETDDTKKLLDSPDR